MVLKISILGSTGSIGLSTLKIVDKEKDLRVELLSANKNYKQIKKQITKYRPKFFIVKDFKTFQKLKKNLKKRKTIILNNFDKEIKSKKFDVSIVAIPGMAGLEPTLSIIQLSKKILVANKESIICGWDLIKSKAKRFNTRIIPIDSEHFSILKLLEIYKLKEINKIYLTASGGPFLDYNKKKFKNISPNEAIKHPKWKMGKKISVDSSTLLNKILEIIEAQKLFNIPKDKIDIIIHPNSLVHAIVELKNGFSMFIYHQTSMIIPIANAIFDGKLDIQKFYKIKKKKNTFENLIFKKVDKKVFPIIKIINRVNEYPSTPIIVNASNEILVDQFLQKKIHFLSISKIIMNNLNDRNYKKYAIKKPKNINQIKNIDAWAKKLTIQKIINE